jgi:uncharacterized membrane protein
MMSELIVAGFQGEHRAAEVLEQIVERNDALSINLKDAVAVYRTKKGTLRLDSSVQPTTGEGALMGGFLGTMLGALLAAPFTAGASAVVAASAIGAGAITFGTGGAVIGAADAADDKATYGISEDLVDKIGGMVQPGQSAVFVLADAAFPTRVAEAFRGYGATILTATLPAKEAKRLQEVVAAGAVAG